MGTLGRKAVWGAALALWVMVPAASASASDRQGSRQSVGRPHPGSQRVIIRASRRKSGGQKLPRATGPAEHKLISAMPLMRMARRHRGARQRPDVLSARRTRARER